METGLHRTFLAMETTFFFSLSKIFSLHQPYFTMETGLHWTFLAMETTFISISFQLGPASDIMMTSNYYFCINILIGDIVAQSQ